MSTVATSLAIHLEADCPYDGCHALARNLLDVLDNGRYDRCAVMKIPPSIEAWVGERRTARKRAAMATRRGYRFDFIHREQHADEVYEIRTSRDERQGREMAPAYRERPTFSPLPAYACGRHAIRTTGVYHPDGMLVAYLTMYRAGELALVSEILGHGDYEADGIMYLLFAGALKVEIEHGQGAVVYNRFDSGTDGLRFFKERLGFGERKVEWQP